jgi:hypothetical protein
MRILDSKGENMTKLKTYSVWAKHNITSTISIKAENLTDAAEKAKALDTSDFITINGDFMDGETAVTGVLEE